MTRFRLRMSTNGSTVAYSVMPSVSADTDATLPISSPDGKTPPSPEVTMKSPLTTDEVRSMELSRSSPCSARRSEPPV